MRQLQDKYDAVQMSIYISRVLVGTLLIGLLLFFGDKFGNRKLILLADIVILICLIISQASIILALQDFQTILRRGSRVVIYSSLSGDTYDVSSNILTVSFTKYFIRNELIGYYSEMDSFSHFRYRVRLGGIR